MWSVGYYSVFDCSRDDQGRALDLMLQVHPPPQEDLPFPSPQRRLVKLEYCGQHSLPIYCDVISQIVIVFTPNTEGAVANATGQCPEKYHPSQFQIVNSNPQDTHDFTKL